MLRQPGYVYIAAAEGGLYKIGQSRNPEKRLKRFSDVPFGLQLLHQIETDDCRWLERRLHDQFWESRVSGEWFRLSKDEVAGLCEIKSYNRARALKMIRVGFLDSPYPGKLP